jgi:hypothetical protein
LRDREIYPDASRDADSAFAECRKPTSCDRLPVRRSESPTGFPRRVAPQQSPLPLHRSPFNRTAGRQSRSRSSCPPPTRVSSLLCAPGVISILRRHRSCAPYRGMLVGTKGVPAMSTTPPAGRTKGCRKNLPNDPRLENGETGAEAEQRTSPWPHEVLARL